MKNTLKHAYTNRSIVSVYTNTNETDKFNLGFVVGLSDDFAIIHSLSPAGLNDGYDLYRIENIYRINTDGQYEKKLYTVWKSTNQKIEHCFTEEVGLSVFMNFAKQNNYVTTIEVCDSGIDDSIGHVKSVDEDFLQINALDLYGQPDGINRIKCEYITRASCNSEEERLIKLLSESKEEKL